MENKLLQRLQKRRFFFQKSISIKGKLGSPLLYFTRVSINIFKALRCKMSPIQWEVASLYWWFAKHRLSFHSTVRPVVELILPWESNHVIKILRYQSNDDFQTFPFYIYPPIEVRNHCHNRSLNKIALIQ